jgi:hypothetical protein
MTRISLLAAAALSTALIAGTAIAQEGTARGGAASAMPSTKQNSPVTGQTTGANPAATTGQATDQGMKVTKKKKSHKRSSSR